MEWNILSGSEGAEIVFFDVLTPHSKNGLD